MGAILLAIVALPDWSNQVYAGHTGRIPQRRAGEKQWLLLSGVTMASGYCTGMIVIFFPLLFSPNEMLFGRLPYAFRLCSVEWAQNWHQLDGILDLVWTIFFVLLGEILWWTHLSNRCISAFITVFIFTVQQFSCWNHYYNYFMTFYCYLTFLFCCYIMLYWLDRFNVHSHDYYLLFLFVVFCHSPLRETTLLWVCRPHTNQHKAGLSVDKRSRNVQCALDISRGLLCAVDVKLC